MKRIALAMAACFLLAAPAAFANEGQEDRHIASAHKSHKAVADKVIAEQRKDLAENTKGKGFGPQSPRDIDSKAGNNDIIFGAAPAYTKMNLCNIHFHKNAEHKGKNFSIYAGNGNGEGYQSGYRADISHLSSAELAGQGTHGVCASAHSTVFPGDTIEVHFVHSTADITPGKGLGSCIAADIDNNPQLRVETQVFVAVAKGGLNFNDLTMVQKEHGKYQAINLPNNTGTPVQYIGSTTGPGYDERGSPFQVSWSVRPEVAKVNIDSLGEWCKGNQFEEDHAHGVRNLVTNKDLLSNID